jgi:hypothetical protein
MSTSRAISGKETSSAESVSGAARSSALACAAAARAASAIFSTKPADESAREKNAETTRYSLSPPPSAPAPAPPSHAPGARPGLAWMN